MRESERRGQIGESLREEVLGQSRGSSLRGERHSVASSTPGARGVAEIQGDQCAHHQFSRHLPSGPPPNSPVAPQAVRVVRVVLLVLLVPALVVRVALQQHQQNYQHQQFSMRTPQVPLLFSGLSIRFTTFHQLLMILFVLLIVFKCFLVRSATLSQ